MSSAETAKEKHRDKSRTELVSELTALEGRVDALASELKARTDIEAALKNAEARLADAIETMSEGFALYDAEERLVFCNKGYCATFPNLVKIEDLLVPGMAFNALVREGAERGLVADAIGRVEDYVRERMERFRNPQGPFEFYQMAGRWIRAEDRKLADGSTVCIRTDITDIKQAEIALRESEALYTTILDNAPALIALKSTDGKIVFANRALCERRGRTADEVIGKTVSDLWPSETAELLEAADRAVIETGMPVESELVVQSVSGGFGSFRGAKFPIFGDDGKISAIGSVHTEITERKRAEQALRESEQQLRLVVDSLPVLITYIDQGLRYVMINKTGAKWYGRPVSEVIGTRADDLYRGYENNRWAQIHAAFSGQTVTFERAITYPDGVTRDVRSIYAPDFDEDGSVRGMFALVEDLTEVKRVQEQLRRAQRMEAIGQVAGGVAHEFNNLLMAITGNLELLLDKDLKGMDSATRTVNRVLKSAFRGKDLTSRLLAYAGMPSEKPAIIDVCRAVNGTAKFLRPMLGETVQVETVLPEDIWKIEIDPGEFESALTNLAVNARDAMPDGGVITLTCTNAVLDDAFAADRPYAIVAGEYVKVSVKDTGTGMSEEVIERAFDPFFTTKDVGKGTGLGLSMVFGLVHRRMHGYLDIESDMGQGTTVAMYLPRAADSVAERKAEPRTPAGARRTILLVEDDIDVQEMLSDQLAAAGHEVLRAADGTEAMALFRQHRNIELLLSDVVLPGPLSGVDLAAYVHDALPDIKVILISGYAQEELSAKGVPEGRYPLLYKPFRARELQRVLELAFDKSEQSTAT